MQRYRPIVPGNTEGLDDIVDQLLVGASLPPGNGGNPGEATGMGTYGTPDSYIVLNCRGKDYTYPKLLVAMHRLALDTQVQQAAQTLGLTVANTGKEKNGHDYIGNIPWAPALKLNLKLGNRTLAPRQLIDFKEHLEEGLGGRPVLNGSGKPLNKTIIQEVYNEMFEVRDPWRSEWLDADFKVKKGVLHIKYDHYLKGNDLVFRESHQLPDNTYVMSDTWIDPASFNKYGLPTKNLTQQKMYYWFPRKDNNSVARLDANSDGMNLSCGRDSTSSNSALGVRAVRVAPKN